MTAEWQRLVLGIKILHSLKALNYFKISIECPVEQLFKDLRTADMRHILTLVMSFEREKTPSHYVNPFCISWEVIVG